MYSKKNGTEVYTSNEYKTDEFGNEIYAKNSSGNEYYLEINGKEIMAKRKNSNGILVPYFATSKDGYPKCPHPESPYKNITYINIDIAYPKNLLGKQLYPRYFQDEIYIGMNGNCIYARDENNESYYAKTWEGQYYAFKLNEKGENIDYPRKNYKGENVYIMRDDICVYPINRSTKQIIYPKDLQGNETYIEINGKQYYPFSKYNIASYAKNAKGDDILAFDQGILYYAYEKMRDKKSQIYPKLKNSDEFYLQQNKLKRYARNFDDEEYYAKIWPDTDFLADNDGVCYYAVDANKREIYPCDSFGVQFYKRENNIELVAEDKNTKIGFYAKRKSNIEFYPKKFITEREIIEENRGVVSTLNDIMNHDASTN